MNLRMIVLIVVFGLVGVAIAFRGSGNFVHPTEGWLEDQLPYSVGSFRMEPATTSDTKQTYKMDKVTYDTLNPYGIVCRIMSNGVQRYDTVVIASDNAHSFHDPRICFKSQYNEILDETMDSVETKTRGTVPITMLINKNQQTGAIYLAAYCYKGPTGMTGSNAAQNSAMFWAEFKSGKPQEGAFYRFIDQQQGKDDTERANFKAFIGQYLDACNQASGGRF